VNDKQRHEQLDAPQMQAVEEVPDQVGVPPVGAAKREGEAAHDGHPQCGQCSDAEHVYPGGDVGGLAVGQHLARRQGGQRAAAHPRRPHPLIPRRGREVGAVVGRGHGLLWLLAAVAVQLRERQQQRRAEDDDHDRDQHQVGD
jgi:hypothetical protein